MYWLPALVLPCWEKPGVSAEALCEHDVTVVLESRLNMNMHLLISRTQKQIQYSTKLLKTVKRNLWILYKPAIIKYVKLEKYNLCI